MKKILLALIMVVVVNSLHAQVQVPYGATGVQYPLFGFVESFPTPNDTIAWYQTSAQTKLQIPITGVGVFSSGTTATVTLPNVLANSVIQVGWYGSTVPAYSVVPSVPTTTIIAGTSFQVKASVSNSDSFYYIIFNHN